LAEQHRVTLFFQCGGLLFLTKMVQRSFSQ
jgi:hypothetical protein